MLKLENINKLEGKMIGTWRCIQVNEQPSCYRIIFEERDNSMPIIAEFLLYRKDGVKGMYNLKGSLDINAGVVTKLQTTPIRDIQSLQIDELKTPETFCRVLGRSLFQFNEYLRHGIPTYNTSSLASKPHLHNPQQPHPHLGSAASAVTRRINGGYSFGGHQIPKPPAMSAPEWYVSKEEVKKPTMWETFKDMIGYKSEESNNEHLETFGKYLKYTMWTNTPMGWLWRKIFGKNKKAKQAPPYFTNQFGHQIPIKKPLTAKKAAY
jgi:hypothetical protein